MSPSYVASKVCQDEFNLALALHKDYGYESVLLQLCIEDLETVPSWCENIPAYNFTKPDYFDENIKALGKTLSCILGTDLVNTQERKLSLKPLMSSWRKLNFQNLHPYLKSFEKVPQLIQPNKSVTRLLLIYHSHEKQLAEYLDHQLSSHVEHCEVVHSCEKLSKHNIEDFHFIAPLLSHMFVSDRYCMEELNTALLRQRRSDRMICSPLILESLPLTPAYINICFSLFSCDDSFWIEKSFETRSKLPVESKLDPIKLTCIQEYSKFISKVVHSDNNGSVKTLFNVNEIEKSIGELRECVDELSVNPLLYFPTAKKINSLDSIERSNFTSGHSSSPIVSRTLNTFNTSNYGHGQSSHDACSNKLLLI